LTNDKIANGRDRRGETLFIDARQLGSMETRVLKVFTDEDIAKIADTVQAWKSGDGYEDIAGFCRSASLDEIEKNGFILTPGRYVGSTEEIGNQGDWRESISTLTTKFSTLSSASNELDQTILEVLEKMTDGII
jgi:type I restriction enzyme M protein